MSAMLKNVIAKVTLLIVALTSVVAEGTTDGGRGTGAPERYKDGLVYAVIGGEVTFEPQKLSGKLERIAWKQGRDKIAELDGGEIEYFRTFKNRTMLNKETGTITITRLTMEDKGTYSADINGQQFPNGPRLEVIDAVTKPHVSFQCEGSSCVLSCKGASTTLGKYAWRVGDGEGELHPSANWTVERRDDLVDKEFTCIYSNPASYALSDPIVPFPPDHNIGLIIGILILIMIVLVPTAVAIWKREQLRGLFQKKTKPDSAHTEGGNGPDAVHAPSDNATETGELLNKGSANSGPAESITPL